MKLTLEQQFTGKARDLLPLFSAEGVTDILINGTASLFVERHGSLEPHPNPFLTRQELTDFIERLVVPLGKRTDAARPYLDGRLADGSRLHLILPPLAAEGPLISIRRPHSLRTLPRSAFGEEKWIFWLEEKLLARKNVLICGGTGSGKTTLASLLLQATPANERVILIEEALELNVNHPHALHLEARPASPDGAGEVTVRTLLKNALRMRPDRIVLGECRGAEAFELIQAWNTGHGGSLSTLHARSALDGLRRLEGLALLSGLPLSGKNLREWVANAVDAVVYLEREGPHRKLKEIFEIQGLEGEVYRVHPKLRLATRGRLCEVPPL